MEKQKILILYSFTNYDKKSLDFVVRTFSENKDVELTLFNAYIPLPKLDLKESTVMEKLKGHYRLWQGRMNALVKDIVNDQKTAERLSLTVLAIAEGLSLFSIFFNLSQLCTDIDCRKLLQSLVPEDDLKFE